MTKKWPYPLKPGTHVRALVRTLDLTGDQEVFGTVVRTIRGAQGNTVTYAIKIRADEYRPGLVEALASRTYPVDTSTDEGLQEWLGGVEDQDLDVDQLPQPNLADPPPQVFTGLVQPRPISRSFLVGGGEAGGGVSFGMTTPNAIPYGINIKTDSNGAGSE